MQNSGLDERRIALVGVLIALVAAFTIFIRVPSAPTGGYINLSDVAIVFIAILFGPWVAMIAGGVGTGLADVVGGFPQFALLSLLAHGLEGYLIGLLVQRVRGLAGIVIGCALGVVAMAGIYFLGETLILVGLIPALAELPANLLQGAVGSLLGVALAQAVRLAYPSITTLATPRNWRDL